MKRLIPIAAFSIIAIGALGLLTSKDSIATSQLPKAVSPHASPSAHNNLETEHDHRTARTLKTTAETLGATPHSAIEFELPEHKGAAFLEEVYNGKPLRVAQDLGIDKRGAMGFDISKRDAISSLGACAHWIVSCVDPTERSLDDCVAAAPTCSNDRPWENDEHTFCCPTACAENYATARAQSQSSIEAFIQTYYTNPTCFPEALKLLEEGTPTPEIPHSR